MNKPELLVLDLVNLPFLPSGGWSSLPNLGNLVAKGKALSYTPPLPAVTCSVQATLFTGQLPRQHGIVANGMYDRVSRRASLWEQPYGLLQAPALWEDLARQGRKVGLLFGQNSLYSPVEVMITPRPLHRHKGLFPWCYSLPVGLYESLATRIGPFDLRTYWGPGASLGSSRWITQAALEVMRRFPLDLLFVYLPHLDYDAQRFGPQSPQAHRALRDIDDLVGELIGAVGLEGPTAWLVISEYAMVPVVEAVYPNRILRRAGLVQVREIGGEEHIDPGMSDAFALVDHQVAHVYLHDPSALDRAHEVLLADEGVDRVLVGEERAAWGIDHPRCGDLVLLAREDRWFAYPWWHDDALAPDFARTVDIHAKPGYDPLELFPGQGPPGSVSQEASLIRGSHGLPQRVPLLAAGPWRAPLPDRTLEATDVAGLILKHFGLER